MRLTRVTTYIAIAGALVVPAARATTAAAGTGGVAWASGVSAVGLVNIPQTPRVFSLSGPQAKSVVELPPNPLVTLTGLYASAAPGHAEARAAGLRLPGLSARLVTASCADGRGSARLAGVSVGGHPLALGLAPNRTVPFPGGSVVLGKQVRNADGGLTVTAIEVNVGRAETVDVASATCSAASRP